MTPQLIAMAFVIACVLAVAAGGIVDAITRTNRRDEDDYWWGM